MASLSYPRTPLSPRLPLSFFRFTLFFSLFTPSLFLFILPTFVIRIDRRRCSYRPTQTSAPTDADARNGRRRCSYRPTRMTFVDVSQCQTVAFAVPNRCFRSAKPLFLRFKISLSVSYSLFFLQYLPLFSSISGAFLLCASSGCSP